VTQPFSPHPDTEPLTRFQILSAMGVTAIVLLVVSQIWLWFDPTTLLSLNWSLPHLLIGVGLGVGITLMSGVVYQLWPAYRQSAERYLEMVLKPLLWFDLIWLGLLPGMSEELLFRGVMLPAIGLSLTGIVISSLCFGVLHFSGKQQWPYIVWASIIGLLLGFSAVETRSLLVPIAAHVTTNVISSCLWKLRT